MKRSVKTISLEYGDARIKFYEIDLKTTSNNIPYLHIWKIPFPDLYKAITMMMYWVIFS